jgi:hypothetical protein
MVLFLSGCSPESLGVIGITVDENGAPVLVLAVCRDQINNAVILTRDPMATPTATPVPGPRRIPCAQV